jgi:hypothetical protein
LVKDLECYDGWTDVGIFVYLDDELTIEECEECRPPDSEDENVVAYYFELPCEPICESLAPTEAPVNISPEEPECNDGILVKLKDTGGDSMCEYYDEPIRIEELSDDPRPQEVRFSFSNNWEVSMDDVELYYDRGIGKQECQSLNSVSSGQMYHDVLTAACNPITQTAEIEVFIRSEGISHASSTGHCGDDTRVGSCSYLYEIPCSTLVVCDDTRRLESNIEDAYEKGFMTDEMKAAEPSDESDDTPYCVHNDYPCKGDEENMVYVCHYSSRAGYQTFCIPEMDSDILSFDKNHHCGPCDGWNGVEHTGQMN